MSKKLKNLLALLLTMVMLLGMLPTLAFAADFRAGGIERKVHVYTEAENAKLENDVFAKIQSVKTTAAKRMGGIEYMTESDYVSLIPQVIKTIKSSSTYVDGTLQQNGNFLVWQTTVGIPCCYDPRMEAELHNTQNDPTPEEIAKVEADAAALLEDFSSIARPNGGSPTSTNIGLIQPYWESSSSYSDSSFTSYSPYYKTTWQNLYGATGGSGVRYSMTNATVDNIAKTMEQCGLVIFDSHGTTDYPGSNEDYTSRANSSYLCLTTNSGVTSTDTAAHTGTYGTYYDCMKGSGYAYVNGQCIANHMTSNAPHSMLYMGICLGMATDRMFAPLRAKGVEVVYGYSQSVSFKGELKSIQSIMGYIQDGMEAGAAIEQSQTDLGCQWDPAYPSYTEAQAKSNKIAFPVVASSEDTYPGHGNVDCVLTAYSTWKLFGQNYTVTATSNNTNYGTVSVDGYTITASPKTGYYAAGYTVTSGTATVTQNGNIFTVNPSSDCTVKINFAAKTKATVNYLANGASAGTVSSYVGDAVTLPTTAPTEGDYTFLGWVENTVAETTTKPTYYKPGASYTVPSANVTLYALYTRSDVDPSGSTVYQLAEGPENGGKYIVVSSESISGSTGYAVGNSIVASNHYLTAVSVTINEETCTATSADLPKVLWEVSQTSGGYTFYNAAVGKYMGLDSSEYLYPSSTALAWAHTAEGYLDNQTDSEGYYYLSYDSSNSRYTTSKQGKEINFYKAVPASTAYYTTTITIQTHTHTMTHVAAVAATCAAAGNIEYWYCADCGKYFSDANGNTEITLESTVIAALGHNWGNWTVTTPATCAQDGVESRTCSRCGETEERTIPATGEHTYGAYISNNNGTHSHYCSVCGKTETENCTYNDVVTPPTATEQGYTTHTCTVCGYSFVDSYTDPLGNDYLVSFSVPAGVTAPADMICHEGGTINLPTAGAPAGYTFLGWVTEDVNNAAVMPTVLTGAYAATASITLKALYSKTETTAAGYELMTSAPTDWTGQYVITYGKTASGMYALKGLTGTKKYESKTAGGSVAYANTGMTLNGNVLTGVNDAYVFNITAASGKYAIRNAATGTYLASKGSYLYSYRTNTASYCRWSLAMDGETVDATNAASRSFTHLGFSTSNYFMIARNASNNVYFWKLTQGSSSTIYTTVIG
jgi:hypothetical protein